MYLLDSMYGQNTKKRGKADFDISFVAYCSGAFKPQKMDPVRIF